MCGNNIPLKKKKKKALLSCSTRKPGAFLRRILVDFFFPPLVEPEPDLVVCKHLALSQQRVILRILHTVETWTKKNLLFLELKSKQTEVLCRSTFSASSFV